MKLTEFVKGIFGGSPTPASLMIQEQQKRESVAVEQVEKEETRAFIEPIRGDNSDVASLIFGTGRTAAGVSVSELSSLTISAVYAAVRVLAETISSLPFKLYERDRAGGRNVAMNHPVYELLQVQGNDIMPAMKMREVMCVHLLLWGNSFSEIERNNGGRIVALWPIHPVRVDVRVVNENGLPVLKYHVLRENGSYAELDQSQVLHISGLGTGLLGKSPIQLHRETLGSTIAAQQYGARFFSNDGRPGFLLKHPGVMGEEAFNRFLKSWKDLHSGPDNAYNISILEEGMDVAKVGLPPADAQFIETRKFDKTEIAAIYRVPPHMIGDLDRATYSNIEQQSIDFVMHSLRPWLVRFEQSVNVQLLSKAERSRYYAEHRVDALLRGDTKTRYEAYAIGRNWGWLSVDDIRQMENMNPLPDGVGQQYLRPLNMVPVEQEPEAVRSSRISKRAELLLPGRTEQRAAPARVNTADAIEPIYLDIFTRIVKREIAEIRSAVKKYLAAGDEQGFRDWLERFTTEHAEWALNRMLPMFNTMGQAMVNAANTELGATDDAISFDDDLAVFLNDYSEAAANRHSGGMRGQIIHILNKQIELSEDERNAEEAIEMRLEEWSETRANKQARRERERSSNAFTKAAWALLGVAAITWRTRGENCPMCNELEGRSTTINLPFVESGVNILGLITSGIVGHPPLHDGCDCYLEPDIGRSRTEPLERRAYVTAIIEQERRLHHHENEGNHDPNCTHHH